MRLKIVLMVVLLVVTGGGWCQAQQVSDAATKSADEVMEKSLQLMRAEKWRAALDELEKLVKTYAESGVKKFGPKYGTALYNKGLCELKIAQKLRKQADKPEQAKQWFQRAVDSFKQCYEIHSTEKAENRYRAKSLMMMGNALQALGRFEEAIAAYQSFLLIRHEAKDWYDIGDFNINLAMCYWLEKQPQPKLAKQYFEMALVQRGRNKASSRSVMLGLLTMLKAELGNEEGAQEVEKFLVKHEDDFKVSIVEAEEALPLLSNALIELANAGVVRGVEVLVHALPDLSVLDMDLKKWHKVLELIPDETVSVDGVLMDALRVKGWMDHADGAKKAWRNAEEYVLSARAIVAEKLKAYRLAVAAYELLLERFRASSHRADYLYNLSRLAVLMKDNKLAVRSGQEFLSEFPQHRYADALKSYVMVNLYVNNDYESCVAWGRATLPSLKPDSKEMDGMLHLLGASLYYAGKFAEAEPYLKRHFEKFPKSLYRDAAEYLHASVYSKLGQWQKALKLLDGYLQSHQAGAGESGSIYIPFALYDKAFVLYSQGKLDQAEKVLVKFQGKYLKSRAKPQAQILLGNIYISKKQRRYAELAYSAAIAAARNIGDERSLDEAQYLMIRLLGKRLWDGLTNKRILDALPYYDDFMKRNEKRAEKSPFYTQIITAALDALDKAGRKLDAMISLEKAVFLYNKHPNNAGTEVALKTFIVLLRREGLSDEEIIKQISSNEFLTDSPYHKSLVQAAKLEVLERRQRLKPTPQRAKQIEEIYFDLDRNFKKDQMDNFLLLKLARFMESHPTQRSKAIAYYQAILKSGKRIKRYEAEAGMLRFLAQSENPKDVAKAVEKIQTVLRSPYANYSAKAEAHYQWLEILYRQHDWKKLTEETLKYLHYPQFAKTKVRRAEMLLALSYDKRNMMEDAIGAYTAVWVNSLMNLNQSAPAMDRLVELLWKRNHPAKKGVQDGKSDRQLAYESAYKYIRRTKQRFKDQHDKLTPEAIDAWHRLRQKVVDYGKDKSIRKFMGRP